MDSWIDELDQDGLGEAPNVAGNDITPELTMAWLVQQILPRVQIPNFDGSPTLWVEFVTKFRDLIHNQAYLTDTQKTTYLMQHLRGEAKRSVQGYANDTRGYFLSLKRMKFLFGQKAKIAEATLMKVTQGKVIQWDDKDGLLEFFYSIGGCLITLRQLNYASDLYSSDTLRQAVRRLPGNLHMRWAEHSLMIRGRDEEPNLLHFEAWLQTRILAQKESYLPEQQRSKNKPPGSKSSIGKHRQITLLVFLATSSTYSGNARNSKN